MVAGFLEMAGMYVSLRKCVLPKQGYVEHSVLGDGVALVHSMVRHVLCFQLLTALFV